MRTGDSGCEPTFAEMAMQWGRIGVLALERVLQRAGRRREAITGEELPDACA